MATRQTGLAMPALVLTAFLFSTPAWADLGSRFGPPPIQSHQTVIVQEGQPSSAESRTTHDDGLSPDSRKTRDLNLKSSGGGMDAPRTTNPHATFNSIKPDELQEHDVRGSGIPLWRW